MRSHKTSPITSRNDSRNSARKLKVWSAIKTRAQLAPIRRSNPPALAAGRGGFLRHAFGKNSFAISQCARRGENFLFGQRRVSRQSRNRRGLWQREFYREQFAGLRNQQQRRKQRTTRVWVQQFWRQPK